MENKIDKVINAISLLNIILSLIIIMLSLITSNLVTTIIGLMILMSAIRTRKSITGGTDEKK